MVKYDPTLTPVEKQVQDMQEDHHTCFACHYCCDSRSGTPICQWGMDAGRVIDGLQKCLRYLERRVR